MLALAQYPKVEIPVHNPSEPFDTADAESIVGGLSAPSKMPSYSTSISAFRCGVGSALAKVAGSTCEGCYARKGCYNFPSTKQAMERRYVALSDPRWVAAMAFVISRKCKKVPFFRWHDSGDVQSVTHLRNIVQVCESTPHISHWLPTREYATVRKYLATFGQFPQNLTVRVSAAMVDGSAPADFPLTSEVVGTEAGRDSVLSRGGSICPAPQQDGKCGSCRTCWSKQAVVAYWKH